MRNIFMTILFVGLGVIDLNVALLNFVIFNETMGWMCIILAVVCFFMGGLRLAKRDE